MSRATTQRRKAYRKPAEASVVQLETNGGWIPANLVDVMSAGCGLALLTVLKSDSTVVLRGKLGENQADHLKAWVRWCVRTADGTFRAGLEFLENLDAECNSSHPDTLDFYEVMQLSPNAEPDTISRVYRMLAFRYHPDNTETGNSEMFLRLSAAHQTLSDPARRANYDARREKSLSQASALTGNGLVPQRTIEMVTAAYSDVISLELNQSRVCWEG
jgi:hypothetical protein